MKSTDYAPRAAPFDLYLTGRDLVGVEVGVDVGAHAEALLRYRPNITLLHLVDIWPNPYCRGFCDGRLAARGFGPRYIITIGESHKAATNFAPTSLDFVYVDQEHDEAAVSGDLAAWFPRLKDGGILGYRNYRRLRRGPLELAVDAFVEEHAGEIKVSFEEGEIVLARL